jgi:hypothetical protein
MKSRPKNMLTISVPRSQLKDLDAIAYSLGYRWGDSGNLSAFIRAIASGEVVCQRVEILNTTATEVNTKEHRS